MFCFSLRKSPVDVILKATKEIGGERIDRK